MEQGRVGRVWSEVGGEGRGRGTWVLNGCPLPNSYAEQEQITLTSVTISKISAFVGKNLVWSTAKLEQYMGSTMLVATYICVKSLAKTSTEKWDSLFI